MDYQTMTICLILFSAIGRNSELFSFPRKASERNTESMLLCLFHGTDFQGVFYSTEVFGTEFREHASIFVPRNGIPRVSVPRNNRNSAGNNHLFRLFRLPRNYFFVGNSQP
jgi:hypothetical protein